MLNFADTSYLLTLPQNAGEYNNNYSSSYDGWLKGVASWNEFMSGDNKQSKFPGGSKERVNRAGDSIRARGQSASDLVAIDTWRAAHRPVLNTFQAILRIRAQHTDIVVAQRHKRKSTIFGKLMRFPNMQLARMDDVAGCRLIFKSVDDLYEFRNKMHTAHFRHKLKNDPDKYDYIKKPKSTGYKGVHDIYAYDVNSKHGEPYKGLLIELQYRTFYQHAWATAVEVVGFITTSQPKFQQGDQRYENALSLASEIIARTCEASHSCHADLAESDLVSQFLALDSELGFMQLLKGLNAINSDVSEKKNVILIFGVDSDGAAKVDTVAFRDAPDALRELFKLEKEFPEKDIVLVRAATSDDMRIAFRNYFSDANEFIRLIENGLSTLAGNKVIYGPRISTI